MPGGPALSYVVAADAVATVERVLRHVAAQTAVDRIELVLVVPAGERDEADARLRRLPWSAVVEVDAIVPLGEARAAGVRACRAPIVFIGETHSYPGPRLAEVLLDRHREPWAAVIPAITNANPCNGLSCAAHLMFYGRWSDPRTPGPTPHVNAYNAAFKREALLGFGPELGSLLEATGPIASRLAGVGLRAATEPGVRQEHLNMNRFRPWAHEVWLAGRSIAARRVATWPAWRRVPYVLGGALIPPLMARRTLAGVDCRGFRRGTIPALALLTVLIGAGEWWGYVTGNRTPPERFAHYEVHRERYADVEPPG